MHLYGALRRNPARFPAPAGRGFTLVELMISLTIGLIVSLAVMMGYLAASQSQRGQSDLSRMQESARFTFDLMAREGRNAAFRNNTVYSSSGNQTFSTDTTSSTFLAGSNDASTITPAGGSGSVTVLNSSDTIVFRYYGMDGTTSGTADGSIMNCLGTGIKYGQLNEDTLYIARDTGNTEYDSSGEPTLYCASRQKTSGTWTAATGSPMALIPGVESMQVLYGEDTDSDGIVNHYVTPANLSSADFTLVRAIMISLVVRSPSPSGFTTAVTLNHFGTDYAPSNAAPSGDSGSVFTSSADGRLRRLYSTVIAVRNAL